MEYLMYEVFVKTKKKLPGQRYRIARLIILPVPKDGSYRDLKPGCFHLFTCMLKELEGYFGWFVEAGILQEDAWGMIYNPEEHKAPPGFSCEDDYSEYKKLREGEGKWLD